MTRKIHPKCFGTYNKKSLDDWHTICKECKSVKDCKRESMPKIPGLVEMYKRNGLI